MSFPPKKCGWCRKTFDPLKNPGDYFCKNTDCYRKYLRKGLKELAKLRSDGES